MTINWRRSAADLPIVNENLMRDIRKVKQEQRILDALSSHPTPMTYTELADAAGISTKYLSNVLPKAIDLCRIEQFVDPTTNETSYAPRYRPNQIKPIALITSAWV